MTVQPPRLTVNAVRKGVIGRDAAFRSPFGIRHLFYADYTASGRSLSFVERALAEAARFYANTHTEDDYSGKTMTRRVRDAERKIKAYVHAGPGDKIFTGGSGSTGALKKLQEMIGVYLPPVTRERIETMCREASARGLDLAPNLRKIMPVVFIGPYEHHTNELMWREAFAEVVVVGFNARGRLDLADLEAKLTDPAYADRIRYASFSAGSNITGIRTPVYRVARICRRHGVPIFFDFAAIAPYVKIDMNRDRESSFDAIFFSPHKFLGGPGSCGILVMKDRLYRTDLPPTTAGGGTVVYVGPRGHDYSTDIETRERAGTPPILQILRAALAMEVKERVGVPVIERIERDLLVRFLRGLGGVPGLHMVGPSGLGNRTSIVSFNLAHRDRILHPKFVTKLLNDLFGIQSRAGCSCAGPYGHLLLGIDEETSFRYRQAIVCGREGLKPGWVRINLHWVFTREDVDFLVKAISFIAENGGHFLRQYCYLDGTGEWIHPDEPDAEPGIGIEGDSAGLKINPAKLSGIRAAYFRDARAAVRRLRNLPSPVWKDDGPDAGLRYFHIAEDDG